MGPPTSLYTSSCDATGGNALSNQNSRRLDCEGAAEGRASERRAHCSTTLRTDLCISVQGDFVSTTAALHIHHHATFRLFELLVEWRAAAHRNFHSPRLRSGEVTAGLMGQGWRSQHQAAWLIQNTTHTLAGMNFGSVMAASTGDGSSYSDTTYVSRADLERPEPPAPQLPPPVNAKLALLSVFLRVLLRLLLPPLGRTATRAQPAQTGFT